MKNKNFLYSLDGIRALATIGIFLFHSGFLLNGTFPVTLFFMLSGFMMYYTKAHELPVSWKDWLQTYVCRKLQVFYPIHVLTFIAACVIGTIWTKPIKESLIAAGLNLLLINPFFEEYALVYNGLSWYLCVTVFLYMISWPLLKVITRVNRSIWAISFLLILIEILNVLKIFGVSLYLYTNPWYRILDFVLGMLIARVYMSDSFQIKRADVIEVVILIVFAIQYVLGVFFIPTEPGYYSVIFTIALYVFAKGEGIISRFLSNKVFRIVSLYSFEFYMVHELVLRCFRKVFLNTTLFYPLLLLVIAVPSFVISCFLAWGIKTGRVVKLRLGDRILQKR